MSPAKSSRSSGAKLLEAAEKAALGTYRHGEVDLPVATLEVYTTTHYRLSFKPSGDAKRRPEPIEDISDEQALRLIEAETLAQFWNVAAEILDNPTAARLRALRTRDRLNADGIVKASRRQAVAS